MIIFDVHIQRTYRFVCTMVRHHLFMIVKGHVLFWVETMLTVIVCFQLPMQSVPITTDVDLDQGAREVYNIM